MSLTGLNLDKLRREYKAVVIRALSDKHDDAHNAEDLLVVQMQLKTAKIPLSKLEPDSKMSDGDVEKKIERALRSYHTKRALYIYGRMVKQELTEGSAEKERDDLYGSLSYLGWHPGRLGATRGETQKQVIDNIGNAVRMAYVMAARSWYRVLGIYSEECSDPPCDKYVISALTKGGLGYKALDPSGAATEADMKARYEKIRSRAYLICARKTYKEFTTRAMEDSLLQYYEDQIVDSMKAAGAKPQDLEPDLSFKDMQDFMAAACSKQHMLCAQKALGDIKAERQTENTFIPWRAKSVREHVEQAGKKLKDIFTLAADEGHAGQLLDHEVAKAEARYHKHKTGETIYVPPVFRPQPVRKVKI